MLGFGRQWQKSSCCVVNPISASPVFFFPDMFLYVFQSCEAFQFTQLTQQTKTQQLNTALVMWRYVLTSQDVLFNQTLDSSLALSDAKFKTCFFPSNSMESGSVAEWTRNIFGPLSWSCSGWWAGLDLKFLPQELCHGFSASWESSIWEIKLYYPGNRTQDLLLSGEI